MRYFNNVKRREGKFGSKSENLRGREIEIYKITKYVGSEHVGKSEQVRYVYLLEIATPLGLTTSGAQCVG